MKLLLNPQLLSDAHGVVVYLPYYLHPALLHWGHLYAFVVEHASQSGQSVSFSLPLIMVAFWKLRVSFTNRSPLFDSVGNLSH
jgi:hypothetical protein